MAEETDEHARGYLDGRRRSASNLLQHALQQIHALSPEAPLPEAATLLAERTEAVATLRRLCAEFGDNDWPENLHLSDVIEKHLIHMLFRKPLTIIVHMVETETMREGDDEHDAERLVEFDVAGANVLIGEDSEERARQMVERLEREPSAKGTQFDIIPNVTFAT